MYQEDVYIYIYIVILSCDSVLTLSGRGEPPHKGRRMSRDYVLHVPVHSQHLCGVAFDMVSFLHSRGPSHEMAACTCRDTLRLMVTVRCLSRCNLIW